MNHDLYVTASSERDTSASENAEQAARAMVIEDDVWERVFSIYRNMQAKELQLILTSLIVAIGMDTADKALEINFCKNEVSKAIDVEVQKIIATRNAR